jgi:4-amino-4-deoxy-L-arabinose transferase-like glycosyltransferase
VTETGHGIGYRDHLLGAGLACAYLALLICTSGQIGMSRDESFYAESAERYSRWFTALVEDRDSAFHKDFIDQIWSANNEHPPLMKSVFALCYLAQKRWGVFGSDSLCYRFGGMLSAGLLLWLIHIFGTRVLGRAAGVFAALSFALLPRIFYHAHLAAFDVPIVLMVTWTVYAYWRSLGRRRWALMTGIAFAAALATKHNSWVLPGILAIHFSWVAAVELLSRARGEEKRLSLVPWSLGSLALIGPALFLWSWPWLWTDTWPRLLGYARFHLHHVYYNIAYFGVNYFQPPFPLSYPWVLTLFTVPATALLLCLAGLGFRARELLGGLLPASGRSGQKNSARVDARQTTVLWLGCLLAPLVMISLPSTPIFGGTKHWFTAYPFLALFAGAGFARLLQAARRRFPQAARRFAPTFCGLVLLAPSAAETAHSHPFGLSHYPLAAGGVPGAADLGMNRQFWGFTTGSLVDFFNRNLPEGGTVWLCDTTWKSWQMLVRDGLVSPRIRPVPDIARADYAIVHHEHHFAEVDFQIWTLYGTVRPAYVLQYDGVPIVSVYRNPASRRARR